MSIKLVISKPTTRDEHLCETCAHAFRRTEGGCHRTICTAVEDDFEIQDRITECSRYQSLENTKRHQEAASLLTKTRHTAWLVFNDADGTPRFIPPDKYFIDMFGNITIVTDEARKQRKRDAEAEEIKPIVQ